jgi:hypothetical protein
MIVHLPIVKLMLRHREERCESECVKEELRRHQHDLARRVHVLEWMTYTHRGGEQDGHEQH